MSDNKLVKFRIIESKGFSKHEQPAKEAYEFIKNYMQMNECWLYINGNVTNQENLTEDLVRDADAISVNNLIVGG